MVVPNTVLLVDNQAQLTEANQLLLESNGYQVFTANSAAGARRILSQERVHLAIIDVRLENDNDPNDVSGLNLAAEIGPPVVKIMLTGFRTAELTRNALVGYLNQVVPAEDVVTKQAGPDELLKTVERVFKSRILEGLNTSLAIQFDEGFTFETLVSPLIGEMPDKAEVEELFQRLFRRADEVKLYYMRPGKGGGCVTSAKPVYNGVPGSSFVVKFGLIDCMDRELAAYSEWVEPFAFRRATVLIGPPIRTHRLIGYKWLFVGYSREKPKDFNDLYRQQKVLDERLKAIVDDVFSETCKIWYAGKRGWSSEDGSLLDFMDQDLSLNLSKSHSEVAKILDALVSDSSFPLVRFSLKGREKLRVQVDDEEEVLPNPLFVVTELQDHLPDPTFSSITHGDLNGRNILVDEDDNTWLIDFYRTKRGPALRDAAELESAIKFELIHSKHLPMLLAFERTLLEPSLYREEVSLAANKFGREFQRALTAIKMVRKAARKIAQTKRMDEYYALLLFYALKMMTWNGVSSIDEQRRPYRQRHALYSAALLSSKFVPPESMKEIHYV